MTSAGARLIAEPGASDAGHYRQRVTTLAAEYVALLAGSVGGVALIVWRAQLFVTLTQRSNIETLTLAFFVVFFGYLGVLSAPGAVGALRIARFALQQRLGRNWLEVERDKMRALGHPGGGAAANLNVILEVAGRPGEAFEIPVADEAGEMGRLRVDGSRIEHLPHHKDGSSDLLAYFHSQVRRIVGRRATAPSVEIVVWKATDDAGAEQYHGLVEFARNLERTLDRGSLWPKVELSADECDELAQRMSAICRPLRDEGFLPQWDFQGEHKLPIIPEPLGLISLSRSEPRVDSVSSMGCAVWVVLGAVAALILLTLFPPWVPGT